MQVSAIKTENYDATTMDHAVKMHFEALDSNKLFTKNSKVLLKPNLLMKRIPSGATTTNPALILAVINHLHNLGVYDITIADSPGGPYTKQMLHGIYETCGIEEIANSSGAKLNYDITWATVKTHNDNNICREFNIIKPVLDADIIINLPKLKTHAMMTFSCGVKNLFGVIPGLQKPELHFRFPEHNLFGKMLTELTVLIKPQLTIVDAVVSMEGDGPSAGKLRNTGWTFAATNVFALDKALCTLIGIDPLKVQTIVHAEKLNLCNSEIDFISDGKPTDIEPFLLPESRSLDFTFVLPKFMHRIAIWLTDKFFAPRPIVINKKCIGCGKCAEICPADTINISGKRAKILPHKCIKCYCCHEVCPVKAIAIKKFYFFSK